jgi:REP element-mobilizing transposase RayT
MTNQPPLHQGHFYHIYNRGNNRELLFRTSENYRFFLQRYSQYIQPIAATYAYCLLPNHFHLSLYIYTEEEQRQWHQENQLVGEWRPLDPQRCFRNLFISYAMAYNRQHKRTGSLFQRPFKRQRIDNEGYFIILIPYIHRNPQTHGLIADFRAWPWSSYNAILSDKPTKLERETVLDWFTNRDEFIEMHKRDPDLKDDNFRKSCHLSKVVCLSVSS